MDDDPKVRVTFGGEFLGEMTNDEISRLDLAALDKAHFGKLKGLSGEALDEAWKALGREG